ncbi:hypothetical protein BH09ACT9_BH09ACT9_00900 [soil metagenome]
MGAPAYEFWYITLPITGNVRKKGETLEDHANRELSELVTRGWEPISVTRPQNIGAIGFLLRRAKS